MNVKACQREIAAGGRRATLQDLLTLPLADPSSWSPEDRRAELDTNVQIVLGYVVRWINAGVGCSKVPDLDGTPLMEDRAKCRISSQHVANWLLHGVITVDDIEESLHRMALLVDQQNAHDPGCLAMAHGYDSEAFLAARGLLLCGLDQPSGCTEPILHSRRLSQKALHKRPSPPTSAALRIYAWMSPGPSRRRAEPLWREAEAAHDDQGDLRLASSARCKCRTQTELTARL
ncbi:hypothetical protein AADR41_30085 [Streptomyces sp. CLV115]|uniref:hypothetical protein n=1 Tax=Streptomyces sp. CLV115 TaxID=3138502 RepID=UPI00313B8F0A